MGKTQKKYRGFIHDLFNNGEYKEEFKALTASTPSDLMKDYLPQFLASSLDTTEASRAALETFKRFATYFTGFQENRKNVYSGEAIATSIPYRIVHDNFPKFFQNVASFKTLQEQSPEVIADAQSELAHILGGKTLSEIFTIQNFNNVLRQNGIDFYNQIIGGVSKGESTEKVRGINECINLYFQQYSKDENFLKSHKKVKMIPLFKQIMSDRTTLSFVPIAFENDEAVNQAIGEYWNNEMCNFGYEGKNINVLDETVNLVSRFNEFDTSLIYITQKAKDDVSKRLFGTWNALGDEIAAYAESVPNIKSKKEREKYAKKAVYSIEEINAVLDYSADKNGQQEESLNRSFTAYFEDSHNQEESNHATNPKNKEYNTNGSLKEAVLQIKDTFDAYKSLFEESSQSEQKPLREDKKAIETIKSLLDGIQNLGHRLKPFVVSDELEKDADFYPLFDALYAQLAKIIPLYNKVRNYVTQKPFVTGKYKLTFDNPTLADG